MSLFTRISRSGRSNCFTVNGFASCEAGIETRRRAHDRQIVLSPKGGKSARGLPVSAKTSRGLLLCGRLARGNPAISRFQGDEDPAEFFFLVRGVCEIEHLSGPPVGAFFHDETWFSSPGHRGSTLKRGRHPATALLRVTSKADDGLLAPPASAVRIRTLRGFEIVIGLSSQETDRAGWRVPWIRSFRDYRTLTREAALALDRKLLRL